MAHRITKRWIIGGAAALIFSVAAAWSLLILRHAWDSDHPSLSDFALASISTGYGNGWRTYGGTWQFKNDFVQNISDDRGARFVNGNISWENYMVEADVEILGRAGDAGLLIRSSQEEVGVDSYHGYFVGIRDLDDAFILGRADFGWHEFRAIPVPGGIRIHSWYHLKIIAYECTLAASVTTQEGHTVTTAIHDPDCLRKGRFGLQSYAVSAAWRNIHIQPATEELLQKVRGQQIAVDIERPLSLPAIINPEVIRRSSIPIQRELLGYASHQPASSISDLYLLPPTHPSHVTIHGVVTLAVPRLYVQDLTGGIQIIKSPTPPAVQIGDEVEISGSIQPSWPNLTIYNAEIKPLWSHVSTSSLSVNVLQTATGTFANQYIETKGRLIGIQNIDKQTIIFRFAQDNQIFEAVAYGSSSSEYRRNIKIGSLLLLRGICVSDSFYTHDEIPFALLMRSPDDLVILAQPPWWNWFHVCELLFTLLLALLIARYIHDISLRSKFRAVMEERERLALEMHDTLAQSFAGLGFQLEGLCEEASTGSVLRSRLESTLHLARIGHLEARRNIASLRPSNLEELGLLKALEHAARVIVQNDTISIATLQRGRPWKIPLNISVPLLRIGQEAIANAVRHANPDVIRLRIIYGKDFVHLSVYDNGTGFSLQQSHSGFGIKGMQKRADGIHAFFKIHSSRRHGTIVFVHAKTSHMLLPQWWGESFVHRFRR